MRAAEFELLCSNGFAIPAYHNSRKFTSTTRCFIRLCFKKPKLAYEQILIILKTTIETMYTREEIYWQRTRSKYT